MRNLGLSLTFAKTAEIYTLGVLPRVRLELAHWRDRAAEIPDDSLRRTAVQALAKRGNVEGAALFATLAPAAQLRATVRALVAFQTAYNYLDALSELPSEAPIANADQLHQALLVALRPQAPHVDYYARNPRRDDAGYLASILDVCRGALVELPSFTMAVPTARAAATRIVEFQTLNRSESQGGHGALARWASEATPADCGLAWWEVAAAAGSSLAVHALIAAASDPRLHASDAAGIDGAYFPWIGALHSLLDSLVDRIEDHEQGQRSLLDYYHSPSQAAISLAGLAMYARGACNGLPRAYAHRVALTAMCSYYLSAPRCDTAETQEIARALRRVLGSPLGVAIVMFRSKRLLHKLTDRTYS